MVFHFLYSIRTFTSESVYAVLFGFKENVLFYHWLSLLDLRSRPDPFILKRPREKGRKEVMAYEVSSLFSKTSVKTIRARLLPV